MTRTLFGKPLATCLLVPVLCITSVLSSQALLARESDGDPSRLQRYVIQLLDPPLATYDGGDLSIEGDRGPKRLAATAPEFTGDSRLDAHAPASLAYLGFLGERHAEFIAEVAMLLGRQPAVPHRYRAATNGMAMDLTAAEATILAESPLVKSIERDVVYKLETYAGPRWLGSEELWNGDAGFPAARGEGIVIGNIDTGINWDHPSFDDTGHQYVNPYGSGIGLCSDPDVNCNNKLVGVYDLVPDDPDSEDPVEENTKGRDTDGHGTHTASTAAGTPVNVFINEAIDATVSGVAPHASIVSYRVCFTDSDGDSNCVGTAIVDAISQAVMDGVDVINYSIGGDPRNPWTSAIDLAYLNARSAGIFVASSAGNTEGGPQAGTITSPALAPWVVAVGNATHNTLLGSVVQNFSGGSLPAPDDMVGASLTDGTGKLVIVHAKDFGYPLCGTGAAQSERTCEANTGATNPWAGSRPFNGEIVVCDRGTYGRVEKGKNLQQAGAGGYILANTAEWGEAIVADDHCLPATHIGYQDGEELRTWLDAGIGHGAQLSGLMLAELDSQADIVSDSSARGPAVDPVQDTLKPNVIAPGTGILAAGHQGSSFVPLSGTSMASPHVAGAAALLKSVHTNWSANQLASAIEMTATQELGKNESGAPATTEDMGAGRPQLNEAVNAGLFLDVSGTEFTAANPRLGGEPRNLNLPGVVSASCDGICTFSRSVTDMKGGGSWTATPVGFPPGTQVTITPSSFSLSNSASRDLSIEVDVTGAGTIAGWVSGKIMLSSTGSPDQYLTVSVYVQEQWFISTDRNGDWVDFRLENLVDLPDATFTAGKPVKKEIRTLTLVEDPTNSDPYDGGDGVFTHFYTLPQGALWLYAETLSSTAEDIDLFVGRDYNQNGQAEESEELCSSHTPEELERCDLYDLSPGTYWILVQNWTGGNFGPTDTVELLHVAIEPSDDGSMAASGPGIVSENEPFQVRVSWDNFAGLPGETWLSAVGVGSHRNSPYNIGLIPVEINRSGFAAAETFPLMDGRTHGLALGANGTHDRMFIDVPPGASSLTVSASGASDEQSNALTLELTRLDFDDGMSNPPFASPAGNGLVEASASGSNGTGPTATIDGGVEPGRWYAVLRNTTGTPVSVEVSADVEFQGTAIDVHPGLWHPGSRPGLGQGYDYSWGGESRALIWYTYDEDGLPAWFISGAPANDGNIWTTDILRVTNDGAVQQLAPVGSLSVTALARDDALFSYTLYGKSGTERMIPLSDLSCPDVNGSPASYTGIWYRGVDGLGGASVLVNSVTQAQIHYLFDADGLPRWLFAQDPNNLDPYDPQIPMLQFTGFCAVCDADAVGFEVVGTLDRSFSSETDGSWTQDYSFIAPPNGSMERTDQVVKLTQRLDCQ